MEGKSSIMEEFGGLPSRLEAWTYETVANLVKTHDSEPGVFDYKEALTPTFGDNVYKERHRDSIRRTVCSMANTSGGGFIIFGVKDRKNAQATDTLEDRIPGIPFSGELTKEFGDKIAVIQPEIHFDAIPNAIAVPHRSGNSIFVVRIPHSPRRPHMLFLEGGTSGMYYRRGDGGTAAIMNHYEVQEQMMYTEDRMKKVILLRLGLVQYKAIASIANAEMTHTIDRFDVSAFTPLLAEVCSLIPLNLLPKALDISRQATRINKRLDSIYGKNFTTMDPGTLPDIQRDIRAFVALCDECEKALESLFGPLS